MLEHGPLRLAVAEAMARIAPLAPDAAGLAAMLDVLRGLAAQPALFDAAGFLPPPDAPPGGRAHRLSESPLGLRALYLSVLKAPVATPPHSHGTWAVVAGVAGVQHTTLFALGRDGQPRALRTLSLGPGEGLALGAQDIHAMRAGSGTVLQLQLYGRALDLQAGRRDYPARG